ncbi:caspase-8 [Denticeps clupeoides]|uniref:Caspase-8 n=1 Tax=Denticeps clupeoides TaxID=299321 RepID=A0AAY4AJ42_9TELE|nr:caspase-8-like [Denticeps clupeoides]
MDNLELLLQIDEELDSVDIAALKFLCSDKVPRRRLESVQDAGDLFKRLDEKDLMNDTKFLEELLFTIRRYDLLTMLGTSKEQVAVSLQGAGKLTPYRKMLFNLAEEMTTENLKAIKFLLNFPKAKLQSLGSFLDVLTEMENQELLDERNVDELKQILAQCDKQLASTVESYRQRMEKEDEDPDVEMSTPPMISDRPDYSGDISNLACDAHVPGADEQCYPMTKNPRGLCLIISNYKFDSHPLRAGTRVDEESLTTVFQWLAFKVEVRNDLTSSAMIETVCQFGKMDHSKYNAFVLFVLSHGKKGTVLGTDDKDVLISDLVKPFTLCPTLIDKPKLFFIQACQGVQYQKSASLSNDGLPTEFEADDYISETNFPPCAADVLIGMATVDEYKSFRHVEHGSVYIQSLCRQLKHGCPRKDDMLTILTRVNSEVSKGVYNSHRQMPQPKYTLTRKLILPVD